MPSRSIGTNRTIGTSGRTKSHCTQTDRSENSLSPLNEMHFTNGVPMECQVPLLVPIVPLIPMDDRNPAVLKPNCSENSLNPLNEMQFTNGVPMECQVPLLVPIVPLIPMDDRNPAVLKPNCSENSLNPLKEMQFTNGVPMECQVTLLVPIAPLVPMDERNPTVLKPNRSENSLSPLNEVEFTNGILTDCQSIPLDSVCVYWTTLKYQLNSRKYGYFCFHMFVFIIRLNLFRVLRNFGASTVSSFRLVL